MNPQELQQILENVEHRKALREKHEPLKPDPSWTPTPDGGYHSLSQGGLGTLNFPPAAYAHGFENGAFALAERITPLLEGGKLTEAMIVLGGYLDGKAQPIRGWKYAPVRQ
jgi:hypothetical protein